MRKCIRRKMKKQIRKENKKLLEFAEFAKGYMFFNDAMRSILSLPPGWGWRRRMRNEYSLYGETTCR